MRSRPSALAKVAHLAERPDHVLRLDFGGGIRLVRFDPDQNALYVVGRDGQERRITHAKAVDLAMGGEAEYRPMDYYERRHRNTESEL